MYTITEPSQVTELVAKADRFGGELTCDVSALNLADTLQLKTELERGLCKVYLRVQQNLHVIMVVQPPYAEKLHYVKLQGRPGFNLYAGGVSNSRSVTIECNIAKFQQVLADAGISMTEGVEIPF